MRRRIVVAAAVAALAADVALSADMFHRASHLPWDCGDECCWPWGRWPRRRAVRES